MHLLYFDPGLGAMLVQTIVAVAAAILLFTKNIWYKIKVFFGLAKEPEDVYDSIDIQDKATENHGDQE